MHKTNHTIYTERAKKLVIAANHFVSSANFSRSFRHDPKMRSSVTRVTRLSIKFMYAVGKIMFWVVVFFLSFFLSFGTFILSISYEENNYNCNKHVHGAISDEWMNGSPTTRLMHKNSHVYSIISSTIYVHTEPIHVMRRKY